MSPVQPFQINSAGSEPDRSRTAVWVPKGSDYGGDLPLLVGIDAEWKNQGETNRVLSYQYFAFDFSGVDWGAIYYPKPGTRYGLSNLLSAVVLQGLAQGKIKKWPTSIVLVAHFTLADLSALTSLKHLQGLLDSVRRTFVSIRDSFICKLWDSNRHAHDVTVTLRDSMLLAPAGKQSLADLGTLVGFDKLELSDGEIEHMDELLENDRDRFEDYALRDPQICVEYVKRMMALNEELVGEAEVPTTLSSLALKFLLRHWADSGINHHAVLGTEVVKASPWSERLQRSIRRNEVAPTAERHFMEGAASECYHGGRNETYLFGAAESGVWTDWDLSGAYTTAMALIGLPDWYAIRHTRDLNDFQPHEMGFARLRFRFPDDTRFPCLPVRSSGGLVFPLRGESYCCSPEIYLALRLGAQVEIVTGCVLPASFDQRPFETFIVECSKRRRSFPKGSLEELFWKELANSVYGKTAQGLQKKRCFDSRSGQHVRLPQSKITNPYFAAFTTSFVRAVLGEIIAALPLNRTVCSATTDGFLTNATDDEVMAATDGPLCRLFAQARLRICGDITVVEKKHRIAQPLGWRTRGQATLVEIPGEKPVLAKAGLKPPMKDKAQHNDWIVDTFITRNADTKQTVTTLRSLPDIWKHGGDLVPKEIVRRVSMDFDWKRRPVNPSTRPIRGIEHVYFDTVPWRTVDEFQRCREAWEQFHGQTGTVLKTVDDLGQFEDFRAVNIQKTGLKRSRRDAAVTLAKRMFLRALTRSQWGLDVHQMSYAEVARWLTEQGFKTTKADVENARRPNSKLVEHVVPQTPAVEKFISVIEAQFPAFDHTRLLASNSVTAP